MTTRDANSSSVSSSHVDPEVSPTPAEHQLRELVKQMRHAVMACCAVGIPDARWGYVSDFNVLEWATRIEKLLAGVVPHAPQEKEHDDLSRVGPLKAGVDGQELPQRGNEPK